MSSRNQSAKKEWTVGAKIWMLSGTLLAVLMVVGAVSYWNSRQLSASLVEMDEVHLPAVHNMTLADMMHDGIRANVYHSIIVSGAKQQDEIKAVREDREEFAKNIRDYLQRLQSLKLPDATRNAVEPTLPKVESYIAKANEVTEIALSGKVSLAMEKLPEFDEKFEDLEKAMGALGGLIEKNADAAKHSGEELAKKSNLIGLGLILSGLFFGIVSAFVFIRSLQKSLNQMIDELAVDSEQVDESASSLREASQRLSDSASKQASALQETASCVDEITAMVNKTSENSKHLEKSAKDSNESAQRGRDSVEQMLAAMDAIRESQGAINDQVEKGNEKISEIVKVIAEIGNKTKVINDIVFQTKLLSFNASVEAARAGEHGKGFSVVAEEVGNLAQMSGNAAKEISDMLSSSADRVNGIVTESRRTIDTLVSGGREQLNLGAKVAEQCGEALNQIVNQVSRGAALIGEITTAIHEQNQGIQEISKAIQMLDQSTQENSAMSSETASLSSSLLDQAGALRSVVVKMEGLVSSGSRNASESPRETESHKDSRSAEEKRAA